MGDSPGKPVIGLAGGIGSGKSTAAARLAELGCAVIDADAIGHELLRQDDLRAELRRRWPDLPDGPDGVADRAALGRIVFADPAELKQLDAIMHPRMRNQITRRIDHARSRRDVPAVVVDAAVLFEAGWDDLCTHKVFVDASAGERAERVARQRHWDYHVWEEREKTQISLDTKRHSCDYNIGNHSTVSRLNKQIDKLFRRIVHSE